MSPTLERRRTAIKNAQPRSIAAMRPDLLGEWDWEKNDEIGLDPAVVVTSAEVTAWWICADWGHSYDVYVYSKTRRNSKCPFCNNKKLLTGFNDLQSARPNLMDEWDWDKNEEIGLHPDRIIVGSNKTAWWRCKENHSWPAQIGSRARQGVGCPYCSNKKVLVGYNDLATIHPEIAAQWHPTKNGDITPQMVVDQSSKKAWWLCELGHEWEAVIQSRTLGCGCPYCAGRKVLVGYNDLATVFPEIADEWNYSKNGRKTPDQYVGGANVKVWWKCRTCSGEWKAMIVSRTSNHSGCPFCAGQKILVGFNDLATTDPDIAAEWHPTLNGTLTPRDVMRGTSRKKVWWICSEGHAYKQTVSCRTGQGTACPYCAGKAVLPGFNDLATTHPDIAAEWHPDKNGEITPRTVTFGTRRKFWFLCKHGHEWKAILANRTVLGQGCPYCAGQRVIAGENDLATCAPEIAAEWHPTKNGKLTPSDVTKATVRKVWWQCAYGHEWHARISNRWSLGLGCPWCSIGRTSSFPERACYYYLSKVFDGVLANSHGPNSCLGRRSIDIWIPSIGVGVEYDGYHWHQDVSADKDKDRLCAGNGIRLFRVREEGCPPYDRPDTIIRKAPFDAASLDDAVRMLLKSMGCWCDVDTIRDKDVIESLVTNGVSAFHVVQEQLALDLSA